MTSAASPSRPPAGVAAAGPLARDGAGSLVLGGRALPVVGLARVYVCGLTPYDTTHLGHAATFVWADVAAAVLAGTGAPTRVVRNVTDVDDALLAHAARTGEHFDRLAALEVFRADRALDALGVRRPDVAPRARQHVGEVVALASALLGTGAAWEGAGGVWFDGSGVAQAAGLGTDAALAAARAGGDDPDDPRKRHPLDVPVWQPAAPGEPSWPSPWGPGRPGWHAECAAMALTHLGPVVDLHAGGADLVFPHHAYEAAMAQAATGAAPFARAWLHVGTVRLDGEKMAKSTGNLVLVEDLLVDHAPAVLRLHLLARPVREAWDHDDAGLARAADLLERLYGAAARARGGEAATAQVHAALRHELDVMSALDVALDSGGQAARTLVDVLSLG